MNLSDTCEEELIQSSDEEVSLKPIIPKPLVPMKKTQVQKLPKKRLVKEKQPLQKAENVKAIDLKPKVKAKGKKKDKVEKILSKAASNLVISTNFKKNETKA